MPGAVVMQMVDSDPAEGAISVTLAGSILVEKDTTRQ